MINYFNFKQISDDEFLITNDFGAFSFVDKQTLVNLVHNSLNKDSEKYNELDEKGFILPSNVDEIFDKTTTRYRLAKNYLFGATSLHIFVLTNECNLNCRYCQAKDPTKHIPGKMDMETAEKAVDIALQSPEHKLNFEFQGGEPISNFDVLKHIYEYAEEHKGNHLISYSVVSNLTLMSDEMIRFLIENKIQIATSLDGPAKVHDFNRPFKSDKGSYDIVVNKIKRIKELGGTVGAIQTTTRQSLTYPREIIDEYRKLGFDNVFIRPLTKLGTALERWNEIGYTAEEFISFYKACLEYIIELNKNGDMFREGHVSIFSSKIINGCAQNYMELRSPCGAGIGQLAYYYNGDVFTCDEGRMLSEMGDNAFKLGNVYEKSYNDLMQSTVCKTMCASSTLECLPSCAECVYQPYCGTCPVLNYASEKNIFKRDAKGYRCSVYKGMLDVIFDLIWKHEFEVFC